MLAVGPYGSWDERGVADPYVIRAGSNYYMFYLGMDRARAAAAGRGDSEDGVSWYKLRANPILELGEYGAFDEKGLGEPAVWVARGYYWMLYTGRDHDEVRRLGLARSRDGVRWEKLPMVIAGEQAWDSKVICDPTVIANGDRVTVWFGGGDVARPDQNIHGQIGLGTLTTDRDREGAASKHARSESPAIPRTAAAASSPRSWAWRLATRGHEVHFITYANPIRLDPGTPRIHYHEVEVSNYPLFQYPPYCLALASRMAEVAEDYDLDLLHVHYAIPHSIAAMLAQQMVAARRRLPFITTLHGTDITIVGMDRSYFPITKFSIEKSDGITSVSQDVRRDTYEVFGVQNEIRVIYNFVNIDIYRPMPNRDRMAKKG